MVKELNEIETIVEKEDTYDTSDPQQVNTARKKASRTRADRLAFITAAMQHEQGRAWFYDILVFCKIYHTPFREDPYLTSYNCGLQNIGMRILADIQEAAPNDYLQMLKENQK